MPPINAPINAPGRAPIPPAAAPIVAPAIPYLRAFPVIPLEVKAPSTKPPIIPKIPPSLYPSIAPTIPSNIKRNEPVTILPNPVLSIFLIDENASLPASFIEGFIKVSHKKSLNI